MTYFLAGAVLGLAGSAHCAAMCGPVLLAINPAFQCSRTGACTRMLGYHSGRLFVYAVLAVPVGFAGQGLVMAGLGRGLAVLAGALLVVAATGVTLGNWLKPVARAWSWAGFHAARRATTIARQHPRLGFVALGLANGLFPCGLLYAAIASAAAGGTVVHSVLFMVGFGAGTTPLLLAVTMSAMTIDAGVRRRLRPALPAVMALAGILLIARGILPIDRDPGRPHSSILSHHH